MGFYHTAETIFDLSLECLPSAAGVSTTCRRRSVRFCLDPGNGCLLPQNPSRRKTKEISLLLFVLFAARWCLIDPVPSR
jgi:hypothetical protein